jgi:hypothetical protein
MFSLGIGSVLSIAAPIVLKYVGKQLASWVITKIRGEPKEGLEKEIIKAFEKGKVESLISKYDAFFTEEVKVKLRAIADLRNLFKRTEKALKKEKYTTEAAQDFTALARILDDTALALSFKEAGIEKIKVKDEETGKEIKVTSEDYFVALLLRFAAAVWTQLGMKLTPSMEGWALEYEKRLRYTETKVELKMEREGPRSMTLGMPARTPRIDQDYQRFRAAYTTLMAAYNQGMEIRTNYLQGVSCLKSAQLKARKAREQQEIHRSMTPNHLAGLVLGFRAEAQYWQFRIAHDNRDALERVQRVVMNYRDVAEQYIGRMKLSQEEVNNLFDCLTLFENLGDGFAGAFRLYRQASAKCEQGKDAKTLQHRITMITHLTSTNPVIHVPDPPPIH